MDRQVGVIGAGTIGAGVEPGASAVTAAVRSPASACGSQADNPLAPRWARSTAA
jgi:3-hydroxyacyl-CoA dehydrogenase